MGQPGARKPPKISRARRRELEREAKTVRLRGQLAGWPVERIAAEIVERLPEVSALEAHRFAAGWTREELSRVIDALHDQDGLRPIRVSSPEICGWEHGRHRPSPERQEYLCRAYHTRPDRLGFGRDHGSPDPGRPPPTSTATAGRVALTEEEDPTNRRQFVRYAGLLGGAAALDRDRFSTMLAWPLRVDDHLLDALDGLTREYAGHWHSSPPPALLPTVRAHLGALLDLLGRKGHQPAAEVRLQAMTGAVAVLVGWLLAHLDRPGAAEAHAGLAERLATEAGDGRLRAHALLLRSPIFAGSPTALALLDAAEASAGSDPPPLLSAWTQARRAEEHARAGDARAAQADLEQATRHLAASERRDEVVVGPSAEAHLDGFRGSCAVQLGRSAEAVDILTAALARLDGSYVAWRSVMLADLAAAHLRGREVEAACATLGEAAGLALRGGELTSVGRVRAVRGGLDPYRDTPAVRQLDERLRAVTLGG